MSRTFHHGDRAKAKRFGYKHYHHLYEGDPARPKLKRNHCHWKWMREPNWFIREYMTIPQRAEVRNLISKVEHLVDLEDTPEFPLAKKPKLYYW